MKKNFYYLSLILGLFFGMVTFSACGGSDDDDNGSDATYSLSSLQGVWSGENSDHTLSFVAAFYSNNTTKLTMFKKTDSGYIPELSSEGTYEFDTRTGVITVTYSDDGSTETFTVANQQYSSFTLYIGSHAFSMKRYTGSDSNGSSSGGSSSGGGGSYDDDDYSGYDSGGSGSTTTRTKCEYCNGSGKCDDKRNGWNERYCHGDGKCWRCDGDGYYTTGLGGEVNCTDCDSPGYNPGLIGSSGKRGNGKCAQCHGSGKCQNCDGEGYIYK